MWPPVGKFGRGGGRPTDFCKINVASAFVVGQACDDDAGRGRTSVTLVAWRLAAGRPDRAMSRPLLDHPHRGLEADQLARADRAATPLLESRGRSSCSLKIASQIASLYCT